MGNVRFAWSDLMITAWSLAIYSLELGWRRNGCHSLIRSIFLHVTMGKRIGSAIQLSRCFVNVSDVEVFDLLHLHLVRFTRIHGLRWRVGSSRKHRNKRAVNLLIALYSSACEKLCFVLLPPLILALQSFCKSSCRFCWMKWVKRWCVKNLFGNRNFWFDTWFQTLAFNFDVKVSELTWFTRWIFFMDFFTDGNFKLEAQVIQRSHSAIIRCVCNFGWGLGEEGIPPNFGGEFFAPPPLPWQKLTFYPSSSMYSLDLAAGLSGTHQHCEYLSRWWTFIIDAVQWVPFLLPVTDPGLSIGDVRFTWSDLMITTWSLAIYSLELGWRRNGCHSLIGSIFLHVTMGKRIGSAIQLKPLFCQCFRCRSFWLTAFALGSVYAYTWIALACR